jgi:signal transduction histidine kinase
VSDLLRTLAAGTANVVGQPFLLALAREVADALGADAAFVADAGGNVLAASSPDGGRAEGAELAVPIRRPDGSDAGHIRIVSSAPIEPSDRDRAALEIVAARAAAEIDRMRVEASRTRIVQAAEDERRRIGRTLHDGPQQSLVAIGHFLDVARKKMGDAAPDAAPLVERARDEARDAGRELRELSRGLNPASLSEHGLGVAVATLAGNSPLPVQVEAVPDERLPDAVETAIYYLVSEALANAARHSGATGVRVRIAQDDRAIAAEVSDDGRGGARSGAGLDGLADRIAALGGTFSVESPPGGGTRVAASIPFPPFADDS